MEYGNTLVFENLFIYRFYAILKKENRGVY